MPKLHPVSAKRKPSKDQVGPRRYKKWQNEAPYGPETFPRKLVWRPLGRFGVDFGVKMGLELEIVGLAKPSKNNVFSMIFIVSRVLGACFWASNCNQNKRVGGLEDPMTGD